MYLNTLYKILSKNKSILAIVFIRINEERWTLLSTLAVFYLKC